ncbi:tyrosine protein phosphatase 1, partial [Aureobasidium melanogenum]
MSRFYIINKKERRLGVPLPGADVIMHLRSELAFYDPSIVHCKPCRIFPNRHDPVFVKKWGGFCSFDSVTVWQWGACYCREYGRFMAAISRAIVPHSSSLRTGLPRLEHWYSSHFSSSYLDLMRLYDDVQTASPSGYTYSAVNKTSGEGRCKRIHTIVLDTIDVENAVFRASVILPSLGLITGPADRFTNTENLSNVKLTQQVWIVRVAKVSEIHVIHDSGRKRAIHLAEPSRGGLTQRCHGIGRIRRCLQNSGLDRTQKSDISRVREEVAMMLGVKLHVSPVNRRTVGVHVVGECQQRRFSIPICAMDENFSAFTTSTKIEINHANITITISVFRWTTLLCPSKHLPRPETTRLSISWKALLWQCGIWIGWHGQRRVRRRAEPHVVRYLGRRRHGVHLISLRVDFAHKSMTAPVMLPLASIATISGCSACKFANESAKSQKWFVTLSLVQPTIHHICVELWDFGVIISILLSPYFLSSRNEGRQFVEHRLGRFVVGIDDDVAHRSTSRKLIGRNGTPELRVTEIASCLDDSYAAQSAGSASIMLLIARREVGQLNVVIGVQAMQPGEDSLSVWQGARRSVFQCFAELFSGQCIDGEGVSMTWLLPGASGDSGGVCSCCCFCSLVGVGPGEHVSGRCLFGIAVGFPRDERWSCTDCSHKSVGDGTFENSTSYVGLLANNSKDTEKTRGAISIASCSTQVLMKGSEMVEELQVILLGRRRHSHRILVQSSCQAHVYLLSSQRRKIVIFEAFV